MNIQEMAKLVLSYCKGKLTEEVKKLNKLINGL